MSSVRLAARVGGARSLGCARLEGWQLAFNKPGRDGSGKANLVPLAGARAWGVAWDLPEDAWPALDTFEPDYRRTILTPHAADARSFDAHVYLYPCRADAPAIEPTRSYLAHLLSGAAEHRLPAAYLARLRALTGRSR